MPQFTDLTGRDWTIQVTVRSVKRIRQQFDGLDLCDFGDERSGLFVDLFGNLIKFVDVLYVLVEDQANERGVTDEDFGAALAGDVLFDARNAFLEGLVDFFPNPEQQEALRKAIRKLMELESLMIAQAAEELERIDPQSLLETSSGSAGNSPESPE